MILRAGVSALVLVALLAAVAGCGGDDKTSAEGNGTDSAFITDMTRHHKAAIEMAQIAQKRAEHPEIRKLAAEIISAQQGEISVMSRIADDMNAMGMDHSAHSAHMGMSDSEMGMSMNPSMLNDAKPFDKAFIDMMVPHHEGAVTMAKAELAKGSQPALRKMATDIIKTQTSEIQQMRAWRKHWYGSASNSMSH